MKSHLTVTPYVTLVGEFPIVDALQGHPFYRHLTKQEAILQQLVLNKKTQWYST